MEKRRDNGLKTKKKLKNDKKVKNKKKYQAPEIETDYILENVACGTPGPDGPGC